MTGRPRRTLDKAKVCPVCESEFGPSVLTTGANKGLFDWGAFDRKICCSKKCYAKFRILQTLERVGEKRCVKCGGLFGPVISGGKVEATSFRHTIRCPKCRGNYKGFKAEEISEILNISVGSVVQRLRRSNGELTGPAIEPGRFSNVRMIRRRRFQTGE